MPAWPFPSPNEADQRPARPRRKPGPRPDRKAKPALDKWFVWTRVGGRQTHEVRSAADAMAQLSESDRQCAEAWLAGGFDREIAERLQVEVERLARVRFDLLADVTLRLAMKPAKAPPDDDWWRGPVPTGDAL